MRTLEVTVYIGVHKGTENQDEPIVQVLASPFTDQRSFEAYSWYRATVPIRFQQKVTEAGSFKAEPVANHPE